MTQTSTLPNAASEERTIRLGTRSSPLAMWQAQHVATLLAAVRPAWTVELVSVSTEGDRRLDVPIAQIGGKGVFVKEVQAAVLDLRTDLAVHSAKDLPSTTHDGLALAAIVERGDPRDAIVGARLMDLPDGSVVATGSPRRAMQLRAMRPDLRTVGLRGNIATRLSQLGQPSADLSGTEDEATPVSAVVVAAAALVRLGILDHRIDLLSAEAFVPQVGQGAVAVECRADDQHLIEALAEIDHGPSRRAVTAERAFLAELGGDCSLPAGAHAVVDGESIHLVAVLGAQAVDRCPDSGGGPASVDDDAAIVRQRDAAMFRGSLDGVEPVAVGRALAIELAARVADDAVPGLELDSSTATGPIEPSGAAVERAPLP